MVNVYITATRARAGDADTVARHVTANVPGACVVSTWHHGEAPTSEQLGSADVVIALDSFSRGGGVAADIGFACGRGIPVVLAGCEPVGVFGHLTRQVRDSAEAVTFISGMSAALSLRPRGQSASMEA